MRLQHIVLGFLSCLSLAIPCGYSDEPPWARHLAAEEQSQVDQLDQQMERLLDEGNYRDAAEAARKSLCFVTDFRDRIIGRLPGCGGNCLISSRLPRCLTSVCNSFSPPSTNCPSQSDATMKAHSRNH